MAAPTLSSIANTEVDVVVTFDQDVHLTQDPETGFSVFVNAVEVDIVSAEHSADTITLRIDPVLASATVTVTLVNAPAYIYDDATKLDAATGFVLSASTNNSALAVVTEDNSSVFVLPLTSVGGVATAAIELELGRIDREIVAELGPLSVVPTFSFGAIVVSSSVSAISLTDGSRVTASLTANADNAAALSAWQVFMRNAILTALYDARALWASLGLSSTVTAYRA